MSALDRLRTIAERPSPGAWYSQGEVSDWTNYSGEPTSTPEADAEFIVTFDPVVVLALLDVAEAAELWCGGEERLLPRRVARALDRLREVT